MRSARWILCIVVGMVGTPAALWAKPTPEKPAAKAAKREARRRPTGQTYAPSSTHFVAGMVVASSLRVRGGVGGRFDYDVPVVQGLGPATLYLAPGAVALHGARSDDRETVIGLTGTARMVFGIHRQLQPFAQLGLGAYWTHMDPADERGDTHVGPAIVVGVGLDGVMQTGGRVRIAVESHRAEDDFLAVSAAYGWAF